MIVRKTFFLWMVCTFATFPLYANTLAKQLQQQGYAQLRDETCEQSTFDALYAQFDALIEFLQVHPSWRNKLYTIKERFIRSSKERLRYSTDVIGFYDESANAGRGQISFYYSTHFHEFIISHYPEFNQASVIIRFFDICRALQKSSEDVFTEVASELGLDYLFDSEAPPVLIKIVKYLPSYVASRPHYDGTAFSLFLDSTDNTSLLLAPYKPSFTVSDFFSPPRENHPRSILLIPGALLTDFSVYPTPHIVLQRGLVRYATIAFAMRPYSVPQKIEYAILPNFITIE